MANSFTSCKFQNLCFAKLSQLTSLVDSKPGYHKSSLDHKIVCEVLIPYPILFSSPLRKQSPDKHCCSHGDIYKLQCRSKLLGQLPFFPIPPLQWRFFTVSEIKICSSITRMFQHCLGGRGARKRQRKKNTHCPYNDGSMYSQFPTFCPKFDKCPEVFWPAL